jgi:hypothetical protein
MVPVTQGDLADMRNARFGHICGTPTREMRCRQRFRASLVSIGRFAIVKVLSLFPVALYGTQI